MYFGIELYVFRTGLLSIIRSLVLYTQKYVFVIKVLLTASEIRMDQDPDLASSQQNLHDKYPLLCIQY